MTLLEQITDLLPIEFPFQIERIEKDERKQEVHIYLLVANTHKPANSTIHSYYKKSWEHLRLFQYRCFLHCNLPIYRDQTTGFLKKVEVSFSRDYSRFTLMYEQEVMRLMHLHHCFSTVARQLGINIQRVESIFHHYTIDFEENKLTHTPVTIAVDETSTRKGYNYITTFFDLDSWEIIGIYDGKSSECVAEFMKDHPYPEAVKNISIDMSPAFISGAKSYLPAAAITFDKWHVIKLIYKHLDKLADKSAQFQQYIALLMEDIVSFYQQKKHDELKAQLLFIADFAFEKLKQNPITTTIMNHFDGIANYAKSNINNGILEGINAKIQLIKRVARGFRYTKNLKKMIRFLFAEYKYQVIS